MKALIIAGVMMLSTAPHAFAIKEASKEEIAAIQEQIYTANKMDAEVKAAELKVSLAKAAKVAEDKIIALERARDRVKDKQNAARTVAIHMTIQAYDLAPANPRGASVVAPTKGRTITWLPVAREAEARPIQRESGEFENQPQPKKDLVGKVYPDGVAYIYPDAFNRGVGYLASTLLHERVHFEQMTTKGKGNKMRRAESEVEAYQAEKDNELFFYDPKINEAEMAETEAKLADEKSAAEQVKKERSSFPNRLRDLLGTSAPPDMFESRLHTNAEMADISRLVAQARSQVDIARRDRESREEASRVAAEKSAHDNRLKNIYADLARRSCANPGSVTQAELDALPKSYGTEAMGTYPRGLDECSGRLYSSLVFGTTAEALRTAAGLKTPETARPASPVRAVQPEPQPINAGRNAPNPFWVYLPKLRDIAVTACNSPGRASIDISLVRPNPPYEFSSPRDNDIAASLSAGLSGCQRRLFDKLFETIRLGHGTSIDSQWINRLAAEYTSVPASVPSRGPRCEDFDNHRCPCEDGTPGCGG